jgi:nucleoid DNA-binding protein/anti-sigma regulatory factor (Ser/Thr protein kinase)
MENVSTSQLMDEIAARTGQPKKAVQATLDGLTEIITSKLADGGRVEIRGFASFSVEERAPRMGRNPRTGKAILIPMTRRVKTRMAEAVKRRVAEASLSTGAGIILALEGDPWAEQLRLGLAGIGYEVTIGEDFDPAFKASKKKIQNIAFVMICPTIDDVNYLVIARELKLDPATSMLSLVRGAAGGVTGERPSGVLIVPDGVFDSVESGVALVRREAERWREEKHYFGRQVTLRSPSDDESVEQLKAVLEQFYRDALTDETEAYKTLSAFREAIDNAAVHGNRAMANRYLTVTLMQDDERLSLDVKDEGPGFDYERVIEKVQAAESADRARERITKGEEGGIGVKMMTECADQVRFLDNGSRVMLVKRRREDARSRRA